MSNGIYWSVYNPKLKKFVSRYTQGSGKFYYVRNPWLSNYFVKHIYALQWLRDNGLYNNADLTIEAFSGVYEQKRRSK